MTKLIEVDSHSEVLDVLRRLAGDGEIKGNEVGLRFCSKKRRSQVLEKGTDRDGTSKIHDDDGDAEIHTNARDTTYLRIVPFNDGRPMCVPLARKIIPLVDGMDYLKRLSPEYDQLVYDPRQLNRVSENEFWFRGNPRKALIAVIGIRQATK